MVCGSVCVSEDKNQRQRFSRQQPLLHPQWFLCNTLNAGEGTRLAFIRKEQGWHFLLSKINSMLSFNKRSLCVQNHSWFSTKGLVFPLIHEQGHYSYHSEDHWIGCVWVSQVQSQRISHSYLNEMHTFNLPLFQSAYIWMHTVTKIWAQLQTYSS